MSSPEKSELDLSAHPPAVKAGGMRIVQDKSHLKKKETPVPKPEEEVLKVANSPPKVTDLMSGATPDKGDFPEAAVKSFHIKPLPTVDTRNSQKPHQVIHQPKK